MYNVCVCDTVSVCEKNNLIHQIILIKQTRLSDCFNLSIPAERVKNYFLFYFEGVSLFVLSSCRPLLSRLTCVYLPVLPALSGCLSDPVLFLWITPVDYSCWFPLDVFS